jgi:hypothetical protein
MIKTKKKDPGEPAVKTTIREDDVAAKRAAKLCERETEGKSGSGTWMWWTDESRTDGESASRSDVFKRRRLDSLPQLP